ncbi:MAG: class I SAM-dependent methyltransferase [Candidatus Rokubacteria bacterium]|nr:class I SAM-dependent methyltransferase [Candidatus Rokubacteria bacterium]
MERDEYQRMYELERTYWWHVGRLHLLRSLFDRWLPRGDRRRILDFGCGTGSALDLLGRHGTVTAVDDSEIALALCRERQAGSRAVRLVRVPEQGPLPFADGSFDLVTALDVLEHLDDDRAALVELRRVLAPGGTLIVFVPAYRFLWSEHDEALHHRRRYAASELHARLNAAGFRVVKQTYAITFSFPLILGYRAVRGLFAGPGPPRTSYVMLPAAINALFSRLLAVEAALVRWINLPFGTSIAAVARRDD